MLLFFLEASCMITYTHHYSLFALVHFYNLVKFSTIYHHVITLHTNKEEIADYKTKVDMSEVTIHQIVEMRGHDGTN